MAETEQATDQESQTAGPQEDAGKEAQSAQFSEAVDSGATGPATSVEILLDMGLPVTASLGRTEIPVRQLLQLAPGSVLQLDKDIDAPADLYVRDIRFATGDIVVIGGQFGIKIKQVCGGPETEDKTEPATD